MECTEIRERLSEYLDGFMDPETEARVQEHLTSCKACAGELASLKALVRELGDLDPVEAPGDFLVRLHEKMERPSGLSKILDTLFRPFKIKIPLEFAGAAAVAVLVFIVLNVQQPGEEFQVRPLPEKQVEIARKVATPPAPEQDRTGPPKREKHARRPAPAATKTPAVMKAPKPLPAVEDLKKDQATGKPAPIELALVIRMDRPRLRASAPPASSETLESMPAETEMEKGVAIDGQARPKALGETLNAEERKAPAASVAEAPAYKARTLPSSTHPGALFPRLRELVALNHGKVLSVEYQEKTQNPRSILVDIPADRMGIFFNSLNALGYLKTPPPTPPEDTGKMIQVLIRFLYPG